MNETPTYHPIFNKYIDNKAKYLMRQILIASIFENIVNWLQIIFNFVILILAFIAIWWAIEIKTQKFSLIFLEPYANKLDDVGFTYTIIVTSFMIILFLLSLFVTIFKANMKWREYRKIMNEIQYLYILNFSNSEYTIKQFEEDYKKLIENYLKNNDKFKLSNAFISALKGYKIGK